MSKFSFGDRVIVIGKDSKGEVVDTGEPPRTQFYKKNKTDKGREVQIVTVRLDGEDKVRNFPEDVLEKAE